MADPILANALNSFLLGLLKSLLSLWWLWLFVIAVSIISTIVKVRRRNKKYSSINEIHSDRNLLNKLKGLTPSEFEDYVAHLFNKLGFTTERVGGGYDGGIDVIAIKNNVKHYIQCKKFITSQVSVGDVRNFYGALVDHLANGKGYFITTNKFTLEAEKFAADKPIELIDGNRLIEYTRLAKKENIIPLGNKALDERCPQCGGNLVKRNGKYGDFFGCQNYPKCKFIKKI